ncbi:MAG: anti-sigma factor family protein [Spirochaetia bacterium]
MCLDNELISAYMDGEVPQPWKDKIKDHLADCSGCRHKAEKYRQVDALISLSNQISEDRVAASKASVKAKIHGQLKYAKWESKSVWNKTVSVPIPVAAAAVILMLMLAGFLTLVGVSGTKSPHLGDNLNITLNPEDVEILLKALQTHEGEIVIELPEEPQFRYLSEPELIKASDQERTR